MNLAVMQIRRDRKRPEDASHKGSVGNHLYAAEKADGEFAICLMVVSGKTGAVIRGPMKGHINHPALESPYHLGFHIRLS